MYLNDVTSLAQANSVIFAFHKQNLLRAQFFGVLFLLLLVVPITACFVVLKNQQRQIRKEVKWKMIAGIDKNELVLLKFSKKEINTTLNWKHNREFQFQNEFYDIVEKRVHKDSVYYWCWWDNEETQLSRKLDELTSMYWKKNPDHKQKKEGLQKLFKNLFYEKQSSAINFCILQFKKVALDFSESTLLITIAPHVPPPRQC